MWSVFHSEKVSSKVSHSLELPWHSVDTLLVVLLVSLISSHSLGKHMILLEAVGTKQLRTGPVDSLYNYLLSTYYVPTARNHST